MKKYEYKIIDSHFNGGMRYNGRRMSVDETLSMLGNEGWRVVAIYYDDRRASRIIMERPKQ